MKSNTALKKDVQDAIKWQPLLRDAEIGVTAKNGVVSLTGNVDSYVKKMEAENVAKKVIGVKALVENIEVKFLSSFEKTDQYIAKNALKALKASYSVLEEKVTLTVEDGWVTLEGELPWNYQKRAAKYAVYDVSGVVGITNLITIKPESHHAIKQQDVEEAIARRWSISNHNIHVEISGSTIILTGDVRSWNQKEEAGRIAWMTPGICNVKNELEIEHYYELIT